jgi:hypothetical protein
MPEGLNGNQIEGKRSLNEVETIALLVKNGAKNIEIFEPHIPILCVLEEKIRGDNGPFKKTRLDRRPSFAVITNPEKLDFDDPIIDDITSDSVVRLVYRLKNDGDDVNLYTIDQDSNKIILVGIENKYKDYHVKKENLFTIPEGLIPNL